MREVIGRGVLSPDDALDKAGNRPVRALQRLRDGQAVELSRSIYRGDTQDFVAELNAG